MRKTPAFRSSIRHLFLVAATVFLAELLLTVSLDALPWLAPPVRLFVHPLVMALVILPVFLILLPRRGPSEAQRELEEHRQRAEETAARYRTLFQEAPLLCAILRRRDGEPVLEDCNRQFHESLGYAKDEVVGRPLLDFYTPESRERFHESGVYAKTTKGMITEARRTLVRRDGTRMVALLRACRLPDRRDGLKRTVAFLVDVTEQEETRERLRESEECFRAAFEQVGVGMALVTLDGRWTQVNRKLANLLGYTPAELIARDFREFTHPDDRPGNEAMVREVLEGSMGGCTLEKRYLRKDGNPLWARMTISPIRDPAGALQSVIAVVEDITERRTAASALQDSECRYRELVDSVSDYLCTHDIEGRLMTVNLAAARGLGYAAEELVGRSLEELVPERNRRAFQEEYLPRVRREGRAEGVFTLLDRDGRPHNMEYRNSLVRQEGAVDYVSGVAREITEQRRTELALARLGAAVDQVGEAVIVTDVHGVIEHVNPAFSAISGYSRAQALGRSVEALLGGGGRRSGPHQELWKALARGETWRGRFRNRCSDGTSFLVDAIASPVRDPSGVVVGYVSSERDVTEAVELEERMRQSQKMEAVGQLAGGVAHDFNNLLTVILGQCELLENKASRGSMREGLGAIQGAADRAAALTHQLLAFGRRQLLQPEAVALNRVVEDSRSLLQRLLGETIEVVVRVDPSTGQVMVDPNQLTQVLLNLAVNARDAMPSGGVLTLETRNVGVGSSESANLPSRRHVVLSVRDTGTGMDADTRAHIFEPFFTTKGLGKGTGLGLATVYGIVQQSGGHIRVESEVGRGSDFHIYLPRCTGTDLSPETDPIVAGDRSEAKETVLLVEDEEAVRSVVREFLTTYGYRALVAEGPGAALLLVEQHPDPIDLLITDVRMPLLSGVELAARIRERIGLRRVLYISGYAPEDVGLEGELAEGSHFLGKPFTATALMAKVQEVLQNP